MIVLLALVIVLSLISIGLVVVATRRDDTFPTFIALVLMLVAGIVSTCYGALASA